jgi:UDP-N-acetylmuramoyl-tripeptide--D-alanyl-D-alanine ligase
VITGKLHDLGKVIVGKPLSELLASAEYTGLSIDSRSLQRGSLFVAIEGVNVDGHEYLKQAYDSGAAGFVINAGKESHVPDNLKSITFSVEDTGVALRDIAQMWLNLFTPKVVAITGTNGKTTTKEMIADVLAQKYNVFRSPGNFNNLYGIPLSLCLMNDSYDICVLELGMSNPGEIEKLTRMVKPDIALITNIGPAHLETMGSIENIASAKFEILDNSDKTTLRIFNLDDPILANRFKRENSPKEGFSVYGDANTRPDNYSSNSLGRVIFNYKNQEIHLKVPGFHNLYNALAACAVGQVFDVEPADIKTALESYESTNSRMQVLECGGITIIDDSYNANPTSMKYALNVLRDLDTSGRRIALLGDMKELGIDEIRLHEEIGTVVAEVNPDILLVVGALGKHISSKALCDGFESEKIMTFDSTDNAEKFLLTNLQRGDVILVKASRAMGFDKIVNALKKQYGKED